MISIVGSNIEIYLGKGLGWIIASVADQNINISKYSPLVRRSYFKLSNELSHPKNGLISLHNVDDNKCFKWRLVRYLHLVDHHSAGIWKTGRLFGDELDFEDIKFSVKIKDIQKKWKNKFYRY